MPKIKLTKEEAQLVKDLQKDWDKVTKPYFANLKRFDQRESEREVEYTKLMNLLSARDRDAKQITNAKNRVERATRRMHHAAEDVNATVGACANMQAQMLRIARPRLPVELKDLIVDFACPRIVSVPAKRYNVFHA